MSHSPTLSAKSLQKTFEAQPFFEDKVWLTSPEPFKLSAQQVDEIKAIGNACHSFYKAFETLYKHSKNNKSLLRNKELLAPWVAEYLERGKPQSLLEHANKKRIHNKLPPIIRPDLLLTEKGFILTELDCVPGGVGLTAFLNGLYETDFKVIGSRQQMLLNFYKALSSLSKEENPTIAIVVSDDAATYLPENQWIAKELQNIGKSVICINPKDLVFSNNEVYFNHTPIHIIYRFFELFELDTIGSIEQIKESVESGNVILAPPMKPFHEEKMAFALFHHPSLSDYWKEALPKDDLSILVKCIPKTWILDPRPVPPNAVLNGPQIQNIPINSWEQLAQASQKDRNFILKISGFHETAWGARSIVLGTDVSAEDWSSAIESALQSSETHYYIVQEYHKPRLVPQLVYNGEGLSQERKSRVRLCPYYAVFDQKTQLSGILATVCPADKKIIHGMKDAAMLPVCQA